MYLRLTFIILYLDENNISNSLINISLCCIFKLFNVKFQQQSIEIAIQLKY